MQQKPMIILTGPTAVGKSALSVELAKKINGAVISADSMQVYRHMDIGSAKITPGEMQGVTHYMIDELEPDEEFHVVRFVTMAKEYLKEIYADGKIPIIAGGTGFYIQALLYDIDFTEQQCDETYRRQLEDLAREHGAVSTDILLVRQVRQIYRSLSDCNLLSLRRSGTYRMPLRHQVLSLRSVSSECIRLRL